MEERRRDPHHHDHHDHHHRRATLSEKFASYYGSLRSMLLGSNLTGRRATYQEDLFPDEATLTAFKKEKEEGQLKPKSVDLQKAENRAAHRTSDYEIPNLLLRRGQTFSLRVTFERSFCRAEDDVVVKLVTGSRPLQSKGSVVSVPKVESIRAGQWGCQVQDVLEKTVLLNVCTAADAIVGRYQIYLDTTHKGSEGEVDKYRYKHPDDIYILFNPWCPEDSVYMEDENEREEHVLHETGRIWIGTLGKFVVRPWNFGQFDDVCLMAAQALLDKSELGDLSRGNPVLVVRAMCKLVNNTDRDSGVLVGNWSGKYDDGVAPYTWNGSAAILEEFLKKRKGVKFGQCWTFAAVATTLMRALGIPTRCVTAFKASHDSDFSQPVDAHWSTEGRPRKAMDDAIWDYHVWNESWFRRPDLPEGHDGWQAWDATPQECNEGVFTCGPASVRALRAGDLYLGYDAKFLFAEVNGERVHWSVDAEGNMAPFLVERHAVGKCLSTKAAGPISRLDLTSAYKQQEGSPEEAAVLSRAGRLAFRSASRQVSSTPEDIHFSFHGESLKSGDVTATLKMKNDSSEGRIVEVYVVAVAAFYTGVPSNDLREISTTAVIEPGKENDVTLTLRGAEYIGNKEADTHVNVYVSAHVQETGQRFAARDSLWVDKPTLEVKCEGTAQLGKAFEVVLKLVNTLSVPLTGGHFHVEGPGLPRVASIKVKKPVGPGEEVRETVSLKSRRTGRKEIIACFDCKQIVNVSAVAEVEVAEAAAN